MKIALLDLVHTTCGAHSNTVPLGIGLIGTYVKKNVSAPVEIKLFKEADKALNVFKNWAPDVTGIAQYTWGAELNLFAAKFLKQLNPNCLIVAGGPNLDKNINNRIVFLKKNNFIDLCVAYDAEIPFLEIIQRLLNGESREDLRARPGAGIYCLRPDSFEYNESKLPPPRLKSLDAFGPVYADGVFDEFLDAGYHPFTQTHRGCPFNCAYCRTSDLYDSKMLFLSPEIFKQDMEYLGKRFAGKSEVMLYIANTNMSLFKEDFSIARIIRETQDKYHWPKYVYFDTGKDPKKLLAMLNIIKFVPAPALQTLTPKVLANINRKNLPLNDYIAFQKEILLRTGENSVSELILCLPGETKKTFLSTVRQVINSGVQNIIIYTLIKLAGTPLASEEFSKKFEYVLRYRVVPIQFSVINGRKIIETEEVIVGTKDLPFNDYLELRGLYFTVFVFFGSVELMPIKKFLFEHRADMALWVFAIHEHLKSCPEIYRWYQEFLKETKEELFASRLELLDFYEKEENFADLLSGKKGDNLVRKYKHLILSENYQAYLKIAVAEARKIIEDSLKIENGREMLDDLARYLSDRDLGLIFRQPELINEIKNIHLKHDLLRWLAGGNDSKGLLENFKKDGDYSVAYSEEQKNIFKHLDTHKNSTLSLQMLYRDGHTKDLWSKWNIIK